MADGQSNNPSGATLGRQRHSQSSSRGKRRPGFCFSGYFSLAVMGVFLSTVHVGHCDTQQCLDLPMEDALRKADISISGTVRNVTPDTVLSIGAVKYFEGLIEIKRVYKGEKLLEHLATRVPSEFNHKTITVRGFGDPAICKSTISKRDTKVFMLHTIKGELFLNSSTWPFNPYNMEYMNALEFNLTFVPPTPRPQKSPCYLHICIYNSVCRVNLTNNRPVCVCEQKCSDFLSPVCGSDNATYINHCHMVRASCLRQKPIKLVSNGHCA